MLHHTSPLRCSEKFELLRPQNFRAGKCLFCSKLVETGWSGITLADSWYQWSRKIANFAATLMTAYGGTAKSAARTNHRSISRLEKSYFAREMAVPKQISGIMLAAIWQYFPAPRFCDRRTSNFSQWLALHTLDNWNNPNREI